MFSGTEAVMIAFLAAGGSTVLTVWKMNQKFITTENCKECRTACEQLRQQQMSASLKETSHLQASINDLAKSSRIQYKMLRALVSHMPNLTADDRERILNVRNGD